MCSHAHASTWLGSFTSSVFMCLQGIPQIQRMTKISGSTAKAASCELGWSTGCPSSGSPGCRNFIIIAVYDKCTLTTCMQSGAVLASTIVTTDCRQMHVADTTKATP